MVTEKAFACLCEDVTVNELREVIRQGYSDIEEIKRITGIGTGPCQGKQCLHFLRRIISEETGKRMDEIPIITSRPPLDAVPFGTWAAREEEHP
jgi:bacterioferritin-associated ferredoxin